LTIEEKHWPVDRGMKVKEYKDCVAKGIGCDPDMFAFTCREVENLTDDTIMHDGMLNFTLHCNAEVLELIKVHRQWKLKKLNVKYNMTQESWVPPQQVVKQYIEKKQKWKADDLLMSSVFTELKHIEEAMPAASSAGPAAPAADLYKEEVDDEVGWCHRSVLIDSRES
jgi:hypothetical protein